MPKKTIKALEKDLEYIKNRSDGYMMFPSHVRDILEPSKEGYNSYNKKMTESEMLEKISFLSNFYYSKTKAITAIECAHDHEVKRLMEIIKILTKDPRLEKESETMKNIKDMGMGARPMY